MKDIPELVEWAAQEPKFQEQLATVGPEILKAAEWLRNNQEGGKRIGGK